MRTYKVYSPEGYVCLERAWSEAGACRQAEASRPGYKDCRAELYEEEMSEAEQDRALKYIEEMMGCLTE